MSTLTHRQLADENSSVGAAEQDGQRPESAWLLPRKELEKSGLRQKAVVKVCEVRAIFIILLRQQMH